jgi:hypothetical protein
MKTTIDVNNANQPNKKGNVVLKNLTKEQKQLLMAGQIGLAALATGVGAYTLMGFMPAEGGEPEIATAEKGEAAIICTEAPFAESVNDNMSFKEAFDAARSEVGPGGFFEYKGQLYNTYTQDEWEKMTPQEQQQYLESIDDNTTSIIDVTPDEAEKIHHDTIVDPTLVYPTPDPEPTLDPIPGPDVVVEVDYLGEVLDQNQDGYIDAIIVDADGNEMLDVIIDTDFDGIPDVIVYDIDTDGAYAESLEGAELVINDPYGFTADNQGQGHENVSGNEYDVVQDDTTPDQLSDTDLNPGGGGTDNIASHDAPNFDNDHDISDYV